MKEAVTNALFSTTNQYVHCTSNMFLMIPTKVQLQTGIQGFKTRKMSRTKDSATSHPEEEVTKFIPRYLDESKPVYDHSKTGFLWSWNFMISRWVTYTVLLQNKV